MSFVKIVDDRIRNFTRHPILFLSTIGIIATLIRIHYFPFGIPVTLDGLDYLAYAFVTTFAVF